MTLKDLKRYCKANNISDDEATIAFIEDATQDNTTRTVQGVLGHRVTGGITYVVLRGYQ